MSVTWNNQFEQSPEPSDSPSGGPAQFNTTKVGMRERIENEHIFDRAAPGFKQQGWHRQGSAKVYFQTTVPQFRPDGETELTASDNGRIWVNSANGQTRYYNHAAGSTPTERWLLTAFPQQDSVASVPDTRVVRGSNEEINVGNIIASEINASGALRNGNTNPTLIGGGIAAGLYTGSNSNITSLPVGSIIIAQTTDIPYPVIARNQTAQPRRGFIEFRYVLSSSPDAGPLLEGTWRARGGIEFFDSLLVILQRTQ